MNSYRKLFAAMFAALFVTAVAFAADASPAGTWKWTQPGRNGGPGFEQTLKLELKDGQLTGTSVGFHGPMGDIPDAAISDASFKDGEIKFNVTREFNGRTMTSKYDGKLDGDTIKGTIERAGRDGEVRKNDWVATRSK
jgi:hypothetical protein